MDSEQWSSEVMWLWDQEVPPPDPADEAKLYAGYKAEGHLVVMGHWGEGGPDREWMAWCSCGLNNFVVIEDQIEATADRIEVLGVSDPVPTYLTYEQVKDWARGHRSERGLDWQDWWPSVEVPS